MAIGAQSQPFLETLDAAERAALLSAGRGRHWERGELLVRAGEAADSAIVLHGGLVKIHKASGSGEEVVLGISGPGDLMGEIVAVRHAARSASATALEDVDGVVISVAALRSFLAAHADAALALLDLTLRRLYVSDAGAWSSPPAAAWPAWPAGSWS
jgi:CRP/FNR family cyclic AMP-dependent transcriptional regulator